MAKLERDYEAFEKVPGNSDLAFNFFVTTWHLLDWVYPGDAKDKRKSLRDSEILLQICDHLASKAKHFEIDFKKHRSVKNTVQQLVPGASMYSGGSFVQGGLIPDNLIVNLEDDEASKLGLDKSNIYAVELAAMVRDYWRNHMADPNFSGYCGS